MKNKKLIIMSSTIIAVCVLIFTIVVLVLSKNEEKNSNRESAESKLSQLYEKIEKSKTYTFTTELDDQNKTILMVDQDKSLAYKEETINGKTSKYVVRDGDTYRLNDSEKEYYKYENNEELLNNLLSIIDELKESESSNKTEVVNGRNYNYVEVESKDFLYNEDELIEDKSDEASIRTRIYFKGDEIKYIKTVANKKEELLKASLKTSVDSSKFKIPSDYKDKTSK